MHKLKFILTVILPITISVVAGIFIVILNSNSILHTRATSVVEYEKSELKDSINKLKSEKKKLEHQQAEYDDLLNDNELLVSEIEALYKELEGYDSDIKRATEKSEELDATLTQKQSYLDSLNEIQPDTEGGKFVLEDNDYKCPGDIPAGKYTAEGSGKIYLKDISNRRKDKIDLSTIDSNSYVFEISSGESITVEGKITLTENIRN